MFQRLKIMIFLNIWCL